MYGSEIRTVNKIRVTDLNNVEKKRREQMHRKEDEQKKVLGLIEEREPF